MYSQYSEYLQEVEKQKIQIVGPKKEEKQKTQFGPQKSDTKEKEVRFKEGTKIEPKESLKYPQAQSSGDLEGLD